MYPKNEKSTPVSIGTSKTLSLLSPDIWNPLSMLESELLFLTSNRLLLIIIKHIFTKL